MWIRENTPQINGNTTAPQTPGSTNTEVNAVNIDEKVPEYVENPFEIEPNCGDGLEEDAEEDLCKEQGDNRIDDILLFDSDAVSEESDDGNEVEDWDEDVGLKDLPSLEDERRLEWAREHEYNALTEFSILTIIRSNKFKSNRVGNHSCVQLSASL